MWFTYFDPVLNFHFSAASPFKYNLGHKGFVCSANYRKRLLLSGEEHG